MDNLPYLSMRTEQMMRPFAPSAPLLGSIGESNRATMTCASSVTRPAGRS